MGNGLATVTKPYYKVVITNHVVEIYEMEKAPFDVSSLDRSGGSVFDYDTRLLALNPDTRADAVEDMRIGNFKRRCAKEERQSERRAQTLRDARNKCKRLAINNFSTRSFFLTLTVAENNDDVELYDDEFKKFVKRLKYHYGYDEDYVDGRGKLKKRRINANLDYIAVREFQARGAVHYHMLVNIEIPALSDIPEEYRPKYKGKWVNQLSKEYNHSVIMPVEKELADLWQHGFVDIEPCIHIDHVGAYLVKYMSKEFDDSRLKGKKAYLTSKGLAQPIVLTGDDALAIVEEFRHKKETFANSYDNEYLGKISYKEYNLKRLLLQQKTEIIGTWEENELSTRK